MSIGICISVASRCYSVFLLENTYKIAGFHPQPMRDFLNGIFRIAFEPGRRLLQADALQIGVGTDAVGFAEDALKVLDGVAYSMGDIGNVQIFVIMLLHEMNGLLQRILRRFGLVRQDGILMVNDMLGQKEHKFI